MTEATYQQVYSAFYCRYNDPSYIKHLKLEILTTLADSNNAYDITNELTIYVNDTDHQLARDAIRAIGRIALQVKRQIQQLGVLFLPLGTVRWLMCVLYLLEYLDDQGEGRLDRVLGLGYALCREQAIRTVMSTRLRLMQVHASGALDRALHLES